MRSPRTRRGTSSSTAIRPWTARRASLCDAERVDVGALEDLLWSALARDAEHRLADALRGGHVLSEDEAQERDEGPDHDVGGVVEGGLRADAVEGLDEGG